MEVEGDICARSAPGCTIQFFYSDSFLFFFSLFCYICSSTPLTDRNSSLQPSISMLRHVRRVTASPLILRLRLWLKLPVRISMLDRTFDALLLHEQHRRSYPNLLRHVLLGTSGAINDETGMTRCLAMKSMYFIDRCSSHCCIASFIDSDWSDTRYCCYVVYRIKNDCAYVKYRYYFERDNSQSIYIADTQLIEWKNKKHFCIAVLLYVLLRRYYSQLQ